VNVSTRYHVRIATRPTLVRQAEHLEYDFRNIGKKSLNVKSRSTSRSLAGEQNKSAVTDHAISPNHVIDWDQAKVIDRESNRVDRWIKEAIHIRIQEGTRQVDEVSSTLPHLRQPVRPESERRTAIRQTVPKKTSVEVETSTLILKMLFLYEFHNLLYRGFRFSFLRFLVSFVFRLFVSSSLRSFHSFVQTVWFSGLRPDTIRPYELSDSVVFGRIVFVFFVRRDFRLLPIFSPPDVYRSAAADELTKRPLYKGLGHVHYR